MATWDDEQQRFLTEDEEREKRRRDATSLPEAILADEARTGLMSSLREHLPRDKEGRTELPEINITPETQHEMDEEPDVIAIEDKPSGHVEPTPGVTPAPGGGISGGTVRTRADELADLLRPDVTEHTQEQGSPWPGEGPTRMDKILDPVRQFTGNAIGGTAAMPATLGSMVTGIGAIAGVPGADKATDFLTNAAKRAKEGWRNTSGASENPTDPIARVAAGAGEALSPAGKFTIPMSAAKYGITQGINYLHPDDAGAAEINPGVTHTVETVGGPAQVKHDDYKSLGLMGVVTLGAIFAPSLYSKIKYTALPKFRPTNDTAPGTQSMSNLTDLARTYDDANAGVLRVARRAGVDPVAMKQLQDTFQMNTRATAQTIANSAAVNGHAEVPNFVFKVPTSLSQLNQTMTKPTEDYIHSLNILERLFQAKQRRGVTAPPSIRGMDDTQVIQNIWALEQSNPGVKAAAAVYKQNLRALRDFESKGEYATLSQKEKRFLNASHAHEVAELETEDMAYQYGNPVKSLASDMTFRIRRRIENEAKGLYVDAVRRVQPDMFKEVTREQLKDNPNWEKNVVTIYRRGVVEKYTTDPFIADVLRMDPYYYTSPLGQLGYSTKRGFEATTTGALAPWFAITSAIRNYRISKITAPAERLSPTATGTVLAIPQQVMPQLAKAMAKTLDDASNGWLGQVLGQAPLAATSQWMANAYNNSLYARVQAMGTHRNSIMEQQTVAMSKLQKAVNNASGVSGALLHGYMNTLSAIHNAPAFAYLKANTNKSLFRPANLWNRARGVSHTIPPMTELANEARNLTGNPHIGGQYYNSKGRPIRFEDSERSIAPWLIKKYGAASEFGRDAIPWFNQTEQGAKRLGEAYLKNPARFTARMWLYSIMPAAGGYLYARSLGNDPNGTNYVDYMMNRRSEYAKTMYDYIPIPGKPAEEGIEVPRFHEGSMASRLIESGLDHLFRSSVFTETEDIQKAAASFFNVAIDPPLPPLITGYMATQGMVGSQGVFGGDAYQKKSDPFDQTGGMSSNTELIVRAFAPGIGQIVGNGWAAFTQTPDGAGKAVANATKQMGRDAVLKTPILRDVANIHPPISGNTEINTELFKKNKAINQILSFSKAYDMEGEHELDPAKGGSKSGRERTTQLLGEPPPTESSGLSQPPPTNPLYVEFLQTLDNLFGHDATDIGKKSSATEPGIGYKSLWNRYRQLSDNIQKMRNINAGNLVTWQKAMSERSGMLEVLDRNGIDPMDPYAVRNFWERKRQDAARVILFQIRNAEEQMSKKFGQPIHIEDLQPYGKAPPNQMTPSFDPYQVMP